MLLPLLCRLRRALSYDVATWADTSSNQASKDSGYAVVTVTHIRLGAYVLVCVGLSTLPMLE
jgi:hypothetical protein